MKTDVNPNAFKSLADALSHDIIHANGEELLAEVAEDFGDPLALAREFDRAYGRASRRAHATRAAGRFNQFLSACRSALTLQFIPARPAMAGLAAALAAIATVIISHDVFTSRGYISTTQNQPDGSNQRTFLPDGTATDRQPPLLGVSQATAQAIVELGDSLLTQGMTAEALNSYNQALLQFQQLLTSDATNVALQRGLSAAYSKIASVLALQGKREEALRYYQMSLAYAQMLADRNPDNIEFQVVVVRSLYQVSTVSDLASARVLLVQALAIAEMLERKNALPAVQPDLLGIIRESLAKLN
jgi:tetratricopeptide (TPR) repeat protein